MIIEIKLDFNQHGHIDYTYREASEFCHILVFFPSQAPSFFKGKNYILHNSYGRLRWILLYSLPTNKI